MTNKHKLKKEAYLKTIYNLVEDKESERKLEIVLNDYYLHCYYYNLDCSFGRLLPLLDKAYIIRSEPDITNISEDIVVPIVDKLKDGLSITEEEADILLQYVVQNARRILGTDCDIITYT